MSKSKIVDLKKCEDGSYSPKREKDKVKNLKGTGLVCTSKGEKPKYILNDEASDFLSGIDAGLDFIENVVPRVDRFLKLRG